MKPAEDRKRRAAKAVLAGRVPVAPGAALRRRGALRRAIVLPFLITGGAAIALIAAHAIPFGDWRGRLEPALIAAGFGLDQVTLHGHRFTTDSDIFDALDLPNVRTMAGLDTAAIRARLHRLPWVESATLAKVYPGRLSVQITERAAFALWLRGEDAILVDVSGRPLSAVNPREAPVFPRISGAGAPAEAAALLETLAHFPDVRARLSRANRIDERRWSLELTQGVRLELPAEGEASALAALFKSAAGPGWLAKPGHVIDLRSATEIAVRVMEVR
jgi:cell division protein FtsQ